MSLFYGYEESNISNEDKLSLTGGTMIGPIDMSYYGLKNVPGAVDAGDAISKQFLEGNYNVKLSPWKDTINNYSRHTLTNTYSYNRSTEGGYPDLISIITKNDFEIYFPMIVFDRDNTIPTIYNIEILISYSFSDNTGKNLVFSYFNNTTSLIYKIKDGQLNNNQGIFMNDRKIINVPVPKGKELISIQIGIKEEHNKITGSEAHLNYIINYNSSF